MNNVLRIAGEIFLGVGIVLAAVSILALTMHLRAEIPIFDRYWLFQGSRGLLIALLLLSLGGLLFLFRRVAYS